MDNNINSDNNKIAGSSEASNNDQIDNHVFTSMLKLEDGEQQKTPINETRKSISQTPGTAGKELAKDWGQSGNIIK